MSYCSQYCREVHWTLNHNLSCLPVNSNGKNEQSTVLCVIDRFPEMSSVDYAESNQTASIGCKSAFETLPVPLPPPSTTTEITTNELCYPSSSASSSSSATTTTGVKKKSFQTFLSLLRINKKRK